MSASSIIQKKTACNRDCGDACGIVATIEDGRVTRLQGDPDHPVTQGFLCHRTSRFLERQYDPDRITTPLVRKGDGFEPISWDEALERISQSMLRIREESGGAAILHYRCGGSMGLMKSVTDGFFEAFGPITIKSGDICTGAGDHAQNVDFGCRDSHDLFDLLKSRTIVLWGRNPFVSQVHLLPILKQARRDGTKVVMIDPVHHRGASISDLYLQPRPGGDAALALGVARVLFDRGLHDPKAAAYCDHFDSFRELAGSKDASQWARDADIPEQSLMEFAEAYSDRPAAIIVGWGLQRRARGAETNRVINALSAVSGNLGIPGGGLSYIFNRRGAFDTSFNQGIESAPRAIPEPMLGPGILEANNPPIRMVWVTAANPVVMLPESRTVKQALESRELTVVVDSFMTDTARCADIVLPTTTMLEDDDLLGAYGHHWLTEVRPVIDAPPEVRTDYEIVQALAPRVGLNGVFTQSVEQWKLLLLQNVADKGASPDDLRQGAVRNPLAKQVLYADRRFATASGRVNLITEVTPKPATATVERPLLLQALASEAVQGSQWLPGDQDDALPATVHPDSATGCTDGQIVRMESEIDEIRVRLRFDANQRRDVVIVPKGGWLSKGRCANALVPARVTDAGGCGVYYDTPVRLLSAEE